MDPIYLDHAATTAVRAEVREAMAPYFGASFGNPSSVHRWGREARGALEKARERLASALGANRREIVFTGGGTEADNLAILGRWQTVCRNGGGTVVCSAIEHKAVAAAVKQAGREGAEVVILGVDSEGRVDLDALDQALAARPCVASVMWANNEVGSIQPVAEIARRCREAGIVYHADAVQSFGKLRVRMDETPCDLLAISGHKIGGPKGIGALFIRDGVTVLPLAHGGGQEREIRPGTENVAAAVGLSVAAELAALEQEREADRLRVLRDRLERALCERVPQIVVNAASTERLPHILNISVPGADQESLLFGLDLEGVAASGASACQSGSISPSHVLMAMGRALPDAATLRLSLGHSTTGEEIDRAIEICTRVLGRVERGAGRAEAVAH
jgi:cysteine desulfurase